MNGRQWPSCVLAASVAVALGCGRSHGLGDDFDVIESAAEDGGPGGEGGATGGVTAPGEPDAGNGTGGAAPTSGAGGAPGVAPPIPPPPPPPGGPGASGSISPDAPSSVEDLPEPAEGITSVDGAPLPLGLWVGQLYFPASWLPELDAICGTDSNRVTLQFEAADVDSWAFGVIVFGDEQILGPQPTDPEAGYPPGYDGLLCGVEGLSAGYPYALRDGRVSEGGALQFRVAWAEPWDSWCSMQTSYDQSLGGATVEGYLCMPALTTEQIEQLPDGCGDRSTPNLDELDCPIPAYLTELCSPRGACICLADGCRAKLSRTVHFALQIESDEMAGLLTVDEVFPPIEVRLRRAP